MDSLTISIVKFINEIGIDVIFRSFEEESFLPGIRVNQGKLLVDQEKLLFPGDLLHEAGHLAVAPKELRASLSDEVIIPDVNLHILETQAISWSFAACVHLGIDPQIVFHEGGYKGNSERLLFGFRMGVFLGLDGLEEMGMTFTEKTANKLGEKPFPKMRKWLRD